MPSSFLSFAQFDAALAQARAELVTMALTEPDDDAIASVGRQLGAHYELASFVTYWGEPGRPPFAAGS